MIKIPNTKSSFMIEVPTIGSNSAIIFLPGISGGAFSERFKSLVEAGNDSGFAVVRISAWENVKDVGGKNLGTIYKDVEFVIDYLRKQGYVSIYAVGKSLGATILLTLPDEIQNKINKEVLWSPVIGIGEASNIDRYTAEALGSLNSLSDLLVNDAYLRDRDFPTMIIHGTADENIPVSNSEKLLSMMPNTFLYTIEGANHSYSENEHEKILIQKTIEFFRK